MSKISGLFLVGFAFVASAGVASAQLGSDAAAMSNSAASQVLSMDGMRGSAKLTETKEANPFAQAASSLTAAPAGSGTGIDIPTVKVKIGSGTSLGLPANSLTDASANMSNALQAPQTASSGESFTSMVVLGAGMSDMSNAIGDQVRNDTRLGK